ncbi:MAG: two-component system response regulator [Pedosphaera sp.]|nr:two-component system response regulator [Pedosphaera sp.]
MKASTILLIEDCSADARLLQLAFKKWGVINRLCVVEDGAAAIDYLSGRGVYRNRAQYPLPGLVLLDLSLPKISGGEVLQWLRSQPEFGQLPVVIFTGFEDRGRLDEAHRLGANAILIKTADRQKLRLAIEDLNAFVLAPHHPDSVIRCTEPVTRSERQPFA